MIFSSLQTVIYLSPFHTSFLFTQACATVFLRKQYQIISTFLCSNLSSSYSEISNSFIHHRGLSVWVTYILSTCWSPLYKLQFIVKASILPIKSNFFEYFQKLHRLGLTVGCIADDDYFRLLCPIYPVERLLPVVKQTYFLYYIQNSL